MCSNAVVTETLSSVLEIVNVVAGMSEIILAGAGRTDGSVAVDINAGVSTTSVRIV
jgi:hypothetical protein